MTRALLVVVTIAAAFALFVGLWMIPHVFASARIDCGPEGIAALNGTACIDRTPAVVP